MSKYYEMSDFEINKAIAEWFGFSYFGFYEQNGIRVRCNRIGGDTVTLDYCNNPVDMWPIIVENDISLINDGVGNIGAAHDDYQQVWLPKDKALRAAAIIFLMMQERETNE